jgi:two-component system chemotaxis sensor kinase CheA
MPQRLRVPDEAEAVMVVRLGGAPVGLVVDAFREGMDVILKPLEGVLAGLRGYAGTAMLGDGRVLLVLNLKELL